MSEAIASKLTNILKTEGEVINPENISPDWQHKIKQAISTNNLPSLVFPNNKEALTTIIKTAYENQWSIMLCGSGSKLNWGGLTKDIQLVISTQRLNRIIEHAVGDLTVTVEAGVKLADLQNTLQPTGQFLALDPTYPQSATMGGIVATADAGSWRQRYGGVRDMLIGINFIRSDGNIAKAGGRVVKNVAGYDLMKLFTGSYGTLGVITEMTFRLYPFPPASLTLVITGDKNGLEVVSKILMASGLTPTAAEILSAAMVNQLDLGEGMGLIVRFQSIPESIEEQARQLQSISNNNNLNSKIYRDNDESNLWQQLTELIHAPHQNTEITCKIGIVANKAVNILNQWSSLGMINLSSGIGRISLNSENAVQSLQQMRALCQEYGGFLTILESPPTLKQQIEAWGYTGNAQEIMAKLKQKFDPKNILNPGNFDTIIKQNV